MKKALLAAASLVFLLHMTASAQRSCGQPALYEHLMHTDPQAARKMQQHEQQTRILTQQYEQAIAGQASKTTAAVTIPVVFHIVLDATQQAQLGGAAGIKRRVDSQMAVINRDFNALNPDSVNIPAAFKPYYGNAEVKFALARRTPTGQSTPGYQIITTNQPGFELQGGGPPTSPGFGFSGAKYVSTGGADGWDPTRYINVWVVNMTDGGQPTSILGITIPQSFVSGFGIPQNEIGLVLNYGAFGKRWSATNYFITNADRGRTLTHELGHLFDLRHIWGDDNGNCPGAGGQDDGVSDTPPQADENYGCPSYPAISCNNGPSGDMFMNFMDYTNDLCMLMFTKGQVNRMNAQLRAPNGPLRELTNHPELLQWPASVSSLQSAANGMSVVPNPSTGSIEIYLDQPGQHISRLRVINTIGQTVRVLQPADHNSTYMRADLSDLPRGMYLIQCQTGSQQFVSKIELR